MHQLKLFKKLPVWFLALTLLGAALLVAIMFSRDYNREKTYLEEIFLQKGGYYLRALEMFSRFDNETNDWAQVAERLWNHLNEESTEIILLAVSNEKGELLAHQGPVSISRQDIENYGPVYMGKGPEPVKWRLVKTNGEEFFLTYRKYFQPQNKNHKGKQHNMHAMEKTQSADHLKQCDNIYLWVGFDMARFNESSRARVRTTALFIGLLGLGGLGGLLALIWAYRSRLSINLYEESRAMASEIIGRLPLALIIEDKEGRIREVNQAAITLFALSKEELLGQTLSNITSGLMPQEESLSGCELEFLLKGGRQAQVSIYAGPILSAQNRHLGRVVLLEDLGELGRLKSELAKGERLAALGKMAAGLAHEIRNPLGAISGLAQHLLNKIPAEAEALEVMKTSADRLNRSISDFLDYAKPLGLTKVKLNLTELLNKLKILLTHETKSQSVAMDFKCPPEVWIRGDETLLSQAFLNIILNAFDSMASQGSGRLRVILSKEDNVATLRFHDSGPGFSAELLAHPFVPYFTTRAEGTGLGLPLVEKTITAHEGGRITLANHPEGGALVTIIFQLA